MNITKGDIERIAPDLVRRTGGGWLAIAPNGCIFTIGVMAPTAEEAREKFSTVIRRWGEILSMADKVAGA